MSSGFHYKNNGFKCTNGIAELFLIKIIKYANDNSKLLKWAIENYRSQYPGREYLLDEIISDNYDRDEWRMTITKSLNEILHSGETSNEYTSALKHDKKSLIGLCD